MNPDPADTVRIAGVGYAVPAQIRANSEILKAFPHRTDEEIVRLTGIKERRYATDDETATALAAIAVEHARAQAGIDLAQIDGIIMATLIPNQPVPAMASELARHLGIPARPRLRSQRRLFRLALCPGGRARLHPRRHGEESHRGHGRAALAHHGPGGPRHRLPLWRRRRRRHPHGGSGGHRLHRIGLSGDAGQFEAIQRQGGGARMLVPHPDGNDRKHFYLTMDGAAGLVFKHRRHGFAEQIMETLRRENLKPEDIALGCPASGQRTHPESGEPRRVASPTIVS